MTGFTNDPILGVVNQFAVSLDLASTLDAMQADSFVLTRLTFNSIGAGTTPLLISNIVLGDSSGAPLTVSAVNNGAATVTTMVPELGNVGVLISVFCFGGLTRRRFGRPALAGRA